MEYQPLKTKIRYKRIPYYIRSLIEVVEEIDLPYFLRFACDFFFHKKIKRLHLKKYNLVFKLSTYLDILTLKEVVIDEEYENHGVEIEEKDRIIVDIGAGFGDFSILTAKKFPQARIFAFEPDPFYFNLLRDNIRLNKVRNIIAYKKAITSLRQVSHPISSYPIPSPRIDFVKIDCEGYEFRIISKKAAPYLKKIKKLAIEYHEGKEENIKQIVRVLRESGFKAHAFPRKEVPGIGLLTAIR